ncbi:DsrE family protein [Sphingomonas sp. OK281]|uniref:DsrE family protein n=1 Tax=Sphingomonas sp. OK281 TaxID=1881067 RepID=UPI0008EE8D76|nr:DsrE family protein [Sphingomonas sp. OK281]SFO33345.1 Intracellular sulfur oxidation protein, DsrE/DsrF family [Sphingomonas sp. OK281]
MLNKSSSQPHRLALFFFLLPLIVVAPGARAQPSGLPAVPSVGVMKDIPDAHEKPDPALQYRMVFDVQTMADSSDDVSPALQSIGGLLNTFRKYGVPADHIQATAVFHGQSIVLVTRDETYRHRTGSIRNPNLDLLKELASAGVELVVCGQSARAQHYLKDDLIPSAQLNLSATITFINLQTRGFVKVVE